MRTLPVKYSPGPFPDGWEPLCLMSIVFLSPTSLDVPSAPKSEDSGDHACRLYRQKRIAWLDELTNTPGRAHRSRPGVLVSSSNQAIRFWRYSRQEIGRAHV